MPDPHIASLTDQVATLQGEIKYLRQRLSNSEDLSSESEDEEEGEVVNTPAHDNHSCCPGLEGQSWVNFVRALDQLAKVTNDVADRQDALEREIQNLSCFTGNCGKFDSLKLTPLYLTNVKYQGVECRICESISIFGLTNFKLIFTSNLGV
ncbi:hypothetical protein DSO57_1010400 [Entomophthora muscae]|uniref:Uncharacterized protein n=1 Tax=Entomophthora muscae TaxID=34485 RepID=A0ACC2RL82_9FUNG|nr:hypothetical protein DSO57_1010400 [Entomophthora muscae]